MSHFSEKISDSFEKAVQNDLPNGGRLTYRAILAVSGGADSSALLTCFAHLARFYADTPSVLSDPFVVVHVDHRLRGGESDGDAVFVRDLAGRYGLPFCLERLDPDALAAAAKREGSAESGARTLRYERLRMAAGRFGARYVLTAHHADDQLETLLIRLFRGSSFGGLTGIAQVRPLSDAVALLRPFLKFSRTEILAYLDRIGQPYRTDSSNFLPQYTRNRVRNELIPLLESIFPNRWDGALRRLADRSAEMEPIIENALGYWSERLLPIQTVKGPDHSTRIRLVLPKKEKTSVPDYVLREFFRRLWTDFGWPLREMGTRQWEALAAMVQSNDAAIREFPGRISVRRLDNELIITARNANHSP